MRNLNQTEKEKVNGGNNLSPALQGPDYTQPDFKQMLWDWEQFLKRIREQQN